MEQTENTPAEDLQTRYPWYDIPHLQNYRTRQAELPRRLNLLSRFRPALLNSANCSPDTALLLTPETATASETVAASFAAQPHVTDPDSKTENIFDMIDNFLENGEHKISIAETTSDEFTAPSEQLPEGNLLTEALASVYEKQGLYTRAIEIYKKLSLLNPEKSVYFAELIAELEKRSANESNKHDQKTTKQANNN